MLLGFAGHRFETLQHLLVNCLSLVPEHPLTISSQFNNKWIYLQSVGSGLIVIDSEVELFDSLHIVDAVLVPRQYLLPDAVSDAFSHFDPVFLQGDHKQLDSALAGLILASLI